MKEPYFSDLIHFVDDEETLANNPLFSKDALSGYVERKEASSKRRQLKTYLVTAKEKNGESKDVCYLCHNNHDLHRCQEYMKKSMEEKIKFLFRKKLLWMLYANINRSAELHTKESVMLVVRIIQLVDMVIKAVRKTKMPIEATHRRLIALWHVQQLN